MERKNISYVILIHDIYRPEVESIAFETLNPLEATQMIVKLDEMEIRASIEVDITTYFIEGENDT